MLSFAADFIGDEDAKKILAVWLATNFSGDERHLRRLKKIEDIENRKMFS